MQRVTEARVRVDGEVVGEIGAGLCVLVGVGKYDWIPQASKLAVKVAHSRIFDDEIGVMNYSLLQTGGGALVVSQFTLYGDASHGRRPNWGAAASRKHASTLINVFEGSLTGLGVPVQSGRFGADMQVALVNDGPVTVLIEVPEGTDTPAHVLRYYH